MIACMVGYKKIYLIVTEPFTRVISFVSVTNIYFEIPKGVRLNLKHYFIMKWKQTKSFIRYSLRILIKTYKKMYCRTIFFLS